ncbi:plasmid replication protein repH [Halorubrum sp. Atlit-26R]|uniref:plasmid replication protein repH n=1 Tax=Halorubrum sp. Atlit-26R TaxID=2282128 RepID=UPI001F4544F1|nr:plasmid replication protein repH [Halorubrum sp. Atlit-26R]
MVTVDRRSQHNTVQLTDLGQSTVQQCLDDNYDLVHPDQRRFDGNLTGTPQQPTSTVSPRRVGEETPAPDEWVATTVDPDEDADYVQWLTRPTNAPRNLHKRFGTVAHDEAITLIDDHPQPLDDGRIAYLSHIDDETLVVLQWGGPLATLGRLAGALLSEKALSNILTPTRLGQEFEAIDEPSQTVPTARILRRGHQIGWCSDAEITYDAWRERITTVRDRLLAQVAELTHSDDTAARSDLLKDLHGLIASATQLYHAVGIDLTTTIRVPDTGALARNQTRLQNLCEFLAKTAPKQSVYGVHSGYRMLFEDRPAKLCRRLPYEPEHDATMDLTMSWVVTGPTITECHDEISTTLTRELTTVREAIADGTEHAPTLEIPVIDGTTYPAIRRVIDEVTMTHDAQWTPRERQRLVRLCLRSFGPADTSSACPYDVVASLLRALNESRTPTLGAVERAAATLPLERFRPDLTPTATKLYATLLRANGPLGRSELIEHADISASSYDRRLSDVRDLDRVTPVQQGGHRRWTTTNPTPYPKTPPVTAWLSTNSNQLAPPLVTHRQSTRLAGPTDPSPDRTGGADRGGWDRLPPISILTEPGAATDYNIRPMTNANTSRQPNSHAHQVRDTRDHPTDIMIPTPHPTTAVTTPQTRLRNGGDQQ